LAVPPARMSLSRCLSSDGTINIEKYRLYRQSAAAALWWHSSVAMDGELNTHRIDSMVAAPLPTDKKTPSQRCPCAEGHGRWSTRNYYAGGFTVVQSVCQKFYDAGTGIVHGEEIPREVSSSVSQFSAIGSVCLRKRTF
jgi:hypothetical protein